MKLKVSLLTNKHDPGGLGRLAGGAMPGAGAGGGCLGRRWGVCRKERELSFDNLGLARRQRRARVGVNQGSGGWKAAATK